MNDDPRWPRPAFYGVLNRILGKLCLPLQQDYNNSSEHKISSKREEGHKFFFLNHKDYDMQFRLIQT